MDLLATLLLSHLVADFPLQTGWVFRLKLRHWGGILLHAAIHSGATAFVLYPSADNWPVLITIWLIHAIIDRMKLFIKTDYLGLGFLVDQFAHGLSLVWIASWASNAAGVISPRFLYPLLAYALIPMIFMYISALTVDLNYRNPGYFTWPQNEYLQPKLLSQLSGYLLVVAVIIFRFWVN